MHTSLELFAGAGGLALGAALAGFRSVGVLERDRWAVETLRGNADTGHPLVMDWPVHLTDVRDFDFSSIEDAIDVVCAGPPCQPFSLAGKHKAHQDERDMFPATAEIIARLRPKAFIIENVRGLTREKFKNYFQYIILQLSFPDVPRADNEDHEAHLARLERLRTAGRKTGLTYEVVTRLLNAADYGVPQKRDRVFLVGFRSDLGISWSFPEETHALDALLEDQWVDGGYWARHGLRRPDESRLPTALRARIERLRASPDRSLWPRKPWRTVRDALLGLPEPANDGAWIPNHRLQPGARAYPGHTGSPLDMPSKALKAGVHGVPGGENMLVLDSGDVRYMSAREAARLQTFPDAYRFEGAWSETMRQLGNAVPVRLAEIIARSVREALIRQDEASLRKTLKTLGRLA